jgi:hypothetical protein
MRTSSFYDNVVPVFLKRNEQIAAGDLLTLLSNDVLKLLERILFGTYRYVDYLVSCSI